MNLKERTKNAWQYVLPCVIFYFVFKFFAWIILVLPVVVFIKPDFVTTHTEERNNKGE